MIRRNGVLLIAAAALLALFCACSAGELPGAAVADENGTLHPAANDPSGVQYYLSDGVWIDGASIPAGTYVIIREGCDPVTVEVVRGDDLPAFEAQEAAESAGEEKEQADAPEEPEEAAAEDDGKPELIKISKKYDNPWLRITVRTNKNVSKVSLSYSHAYGSGDYMTDYKPTEKNGEYHWYLKYPVSEHGGRVRFTVTVYGTDRSKFSKSFEYKVPVLGH